MPFERPATEKEQGGVDQEKEEVRKKFETLGMRAAELLPRYRATDYGTSDVFRDLKANAAMVEAMSKEEDRDPQQRRRFATAARTYQQLASISEQMIGLRLGQLPIGEREAYLHQHAEVDRILEAYREDLSKYAGPFAERQKLLEEQAKFYAKRKSLEQTLPRLEQ